jgi:hypothetical protein
MVCSIAMLCCRLHLGVDGLERIVVFAQISLGVRDSLIRLGYFVGE